MKPEGKHGGDVVLYEQRGSVALVTMNRPEYRNAQNSAMTYALDRAFYQAAQDESINVIVLSGAGPSFSSGHDAGSPGKDIDKTFQRTSMWPNHVGKGEIEGMFKRKQEVFIEFCRRWRGIPKPTIAMVHGACVAGGLMLAWVCDIIVAADDAFFSDPIVRLGAPGVEYLAHPWEMRPRFAKEFLFLGERIDAQRALEMGMINRVVTRASLETTVMDIANRIATMPPVAVTLAKMSVNFAEDQMGLRSATDYAFIAQQLATAITVETRFREGTETTGSIGAMKQWAKGQGATIQRGRGSKK